jgi:hypothetical protein
LEFDFQFDETQWKAAGRIHPVSEGRSVPPLDGSRCLYNDWIFQRGLDNCGENAGYLAC